VIFDGSRAAAVEYDTDTGRHTIRAAREIILCGGAVNTPQLLMLSGIGDAAHLADHGIRVQHHAPEVGRNLLDHLVVMVGWTTTADTLYGAETPEELDAYVNRQMGKLTSNIAEAYGFVRSLRISRCPTSSCSSGRRRSTTKG
jgi:choline dehydrogenase